jgi:hypothetical protein
VLPEGQVVEFIQQIVELVKHYGSSVALVLTWAGIALVYWRRRGEWLRKQFMGQVNFSLNYVNGGTLVMRTLLETKASEVWLNDYGVKKVFGAAEKTTVEQPFLSMDDPGDMDFLNRAVLNVISERFGEMFLAKALGAPVRTGTFVFGVTYERYEDIRTLKLRVILIEAKVLEELFGADGLADKMTLTHPTYKARRATLKVLHDLHRQGQASGKPLIGEMELGVPE